MWQPPPAVAPAPIVRHYTITSTHALVYVLILLAIAGGIRYARRDVGKYFGTPVPTTYDDTALGIEMKFGDGWERMAPEMLADPQFYHPKAGFFLPSRDARRPAMELFVWRTDLKDPLPDSLTLEAITELAQTVNRHTTQVVHARGGRSRADAARETPVGGKQGLRIDAITSLDMNMETFAGYRDKRLYVFLFLYRPDVLRIEDDEQEVAFRRRLADSMAYWRL